jgi:hypothetical protein
MSNELKNGAVLPTGLMGIDHSSRMDAFRKTYQNCTLKVGLVKACYDITNVNNLSKTTPEYDVLVSEQNEDKGSTMLVYKNCIVAQSFGSKADFFEAHLRPFTKKTTKGFLTFSGQNGAIVLLLCLNGTGDIGIIVGSLSHPDRPTTLTDAGPHAEGEYNGVNIVVNKDGSCTFTFKGATDSDGNPLDSSQGNTVAKIETDGSFQVNHSAATFRLDKSGVATLTTSSDVNINASGACNITSSGKTVVQASEVDLNGSSGQVLTNVTDPIVDTIFGTPTQGVPTVKSG